MNNILAKTIYTARKAKNYTLKDLSEMTNKSISYLCEIEHGRKTPSIKTIKKLFNALNINLNKLEEIICEDFNN